MNRDVFRLAAVRARTGSASILPVVAMLCGACAAEVTSDGATHGDVQAVTAALVSVPVSGVPLPINTTTLKSVWNGTYPELLAADAMAECALTQRVGIYEGGPVNVANLPPLAETDYTLGRVASHMSAAMCPSAPPSAPAGYSFAETFHYRWLEGRKIKACNLDPATQQTKALDVSFTSLTTDSKYAIPSVATYQSASPGPAFTGTELSQARAKAQDAVHYAWLNLCMAQQLREHLESVQVALTSEQDLLQLQEMIRERATRAVYQYTTILKTIDGSTPSTVISNPYQFHALIRRWRDKDTRWTATPSPGSIPEQLGQDLAMSVQLLVESSEQHTESLVRSGSAQAGFGTYDTYTNSPLITYRPGNDSGLYGPRVDALKTAYGQGYWPQPRAMVTDMGAPEVTALLGLLRSANALRITGASMAFNLTTNANAMVDAAELFVRQQDCTADVDVCPAAIPGGLPRDQYLVRQRYNIQPAHAVALVKAILEHMYGQPGRDLYTPNGTWTYRFDTQNVLLGIPMDFLDRFPGLHTYTGDFSTAGGGTLTLAPTTQVVAPTAAAQQSQAWSLIPLDNGAVAQALHAHDVGYLIRGLQPQLTNAVQPVFPIGSQSALAYAREMLSRTHVNAGAAIVAAGPKLWSLLENAIGARQAIIKRRVISTTSANCFNWAYYTGAGVLTFPASCNMPADSLSGTNVIVDVIVNTRAGDPYNRVFLKTVTNPAVMPGTTQVWNFVTDVVDPSISSVTGEVVRRTEGGGMALPPNAFFEIRLADASGNTIPLYRGRMEQPVTYAGALTAGPITGIPPQYQRPALFARSATYSGRLNRQLDRAFEFQENDWSKPRYDGLDLPTDWAPVGDASLHGGQIGEEAYQYFLRSAASAAGEATSAIDNAFESLSVEAADSLALNQAQERGKTLTALEEQSFCGEAAVGEGIGNCSPAFQQVVLSIPACPAGVNGACTQMRTDLGKLLGTDMQTAGRGISIASDVATQLTSTVPSFAKYSGGQLEGLLLNQWAAYKALEGALKTAVAAGAAGEGEISAANTEATAARAEYGATLTNLLTGPGGLFSALAGFAAEQAQVTTLTNDKNNFQTQIDNANRESSQECSQAAYAAAMLSGYSLSGKNRNPEVDLNTGNWEVPKSSADDGGSRGWSPGPVEAQKQKCAAAQELAADQLALQAVLVDSIDAGIAAAKASIVAHQLNAFINLPAQAYAAHERAQVAPARVAAVNDAIAAARATQLELVQNAFGLLLGSGVALTTSANQVELAKARIDLETSLEGVNVAARFSLRRAFRSYDLWRARALSENARRLAVAARRAIESRFVVDLGSLQSPESFVEAPKLWADEIYSADLRPPSALGRTAAPTDGTGVYSSKLVDYVNNLRLFVEGYAISRPTASVRSDTEILQLPGPASVSEVIAGDGTVFQFRDIESGGWYFYCPNLTTSWVAHPNRAQFNPASWTLSTVCGAGQPPPTRARLGFWLDPWGRPQGVIANPPFTVRHNARWGEFAVNLVGSGVRDCSAADDPSACYAEPFIRYELAHVGPALISDFDQSWVSTDIPIGVVEGGKALASEEWLDPVANSFQSAVVMNVAREEFAGRPLGGAYELILELTPDVRPERIERIQVLMQSDYWVRQQ